MVDAEETAVAKVDRRHHRDAGAVQLHGTDPTEWPCRVRHLVIFRAPIIGCVRRVA